ncbi:uncharacterized protein [Malus domestica]|uniref:uncharacterized protein isoform X3 n=1 Tax=Malus domestica TaxID=3750 RepID=UPI0039763186
MYLFEVIHLVLMESVDSVLTRMGIMEDPVRSVVTLAIKMELLLISSLLSGLFCSVICSDPKLDSHRFNDILNEAITAGDEIHYEC